MTASVRSALFAPNPAADEFVRPLPCPFGAQRPTGSPTWLQPPHIRNRLTSMGGTLDGRINDHVGVHAAMSYASSLSMRAGEVVILENTYERHDCDSLVPQDEGHHGSSATSKCADRRSQAL
jgi:hypothetical protein